VPGPHESPPGRLGDGVFKLAEREGSRSSHTKAYIRSISYAPMQPTYRSVETLSRPVWPREQWAPSIRPGDAVSARSGSGQGRELRAGGGGNTVDFAVAKTKLARGGCTFLRFLGHGAQKTPLGSRAR
jgi:hypothetical protein